MSKKHAEEIARKYVQSQQQHFGKATPQAIEKAVQRVAGALHSMTSANVTQNGLGQSRLCSNRTPSAVGKRV